MGEDGEEISELPQDALTDEAAAGIDAAATGVPPIPFYLVEKQYNKTTKLLSNSGTDNPIQAKNRWHDYAFTEPIFLAFMDIQGTQIADSDDYKIRVILDNGSTKELKARPSDGSLRVDINEFCKSVSFKPPSIFWNIFSRSPELQKVCLWGFYKSNLGEYIYHIARIKKIKTSAIEEIIKIRDSATSEQATLDAKRVELEGVDDRIAGSEANLAVLNTKVAEKEAQDAELQAKVDRSYTQLESLSQQVSERRAELETVTQSREVTKREIVGAKDELKKLKENINLFPSEISGFVNQASRDIRTYMIFFAVLLGVIVCMFVWVLTGAFDLSEFVQDNPTVDVWPLLMAKLPLAIAVSAIIAACYKISRVFVEEILKINRQKLSLTQVSIVAKDVSQSAESGLGLSDIQIYGLRLRAKMAMLSDHLMTFVPTTPHALFPQSIFDPFDHKGNEENGAEPADARDEAADHNNELQSQDDSQ